MSTDSDRDPLRAITTAVFRMSYAAGMLNELLDPQRITDQGMVESSAEEARGSVAEALVILTTCMGAWYER
jgi:hypothetical protein